MCPVCETTLDQSNAPVAERMKAFIRERIAAGDSEQEIKDALVAAVRPGGARDSLPSGGFGLLAWLIPLAARRGGVIVVVAVLVRGWSRRRASDDETASEEPLDAGLERRVDEELARFDG